MSSEMPAKGPQRSERAYHLSDAMMRQLQRLYNSTGYPVQIIEQSVATALIVRGFAEHTNPSDHVSYPKTYRITKAGVSAYRIETIQRYWKEA